MTRARSLASHWRSKGGRQGNKARLSAIIKHYLFIWVECLGRISSFVLIILLLRLLLLRLHDHQQQHCNESKQWKQHGGSSTPSIHNKAKGLRIANVSSFENLANSIWLRELSLPSSLRARVLAPNGHAIRPIIRYLAIAIVCDDKRSRELWVIGRKKKVGGGQIADGQGVTSERAHQER